jgi:hypothetical protein
MLKMQNISLLPTLMKYISRGVFLDVFAMWTQVVWTLTGKACNTYKRIVPEFLDLHQFLSTNIKQPLTLWASKCCRSWDVVSIVCLWTPLFASRDGPTHWMTSSFITNYIHHMDQHLWCQLGFVQGLCLTGWLLWVNRPNRILLSYKVVHNINHGTQLGFKSLIDDM